VSEPWKLENFVPAIERWVEQDQVSDEHRIQVIRWVLELSRDPFPPQSAPVEGFGPTVWFAVAPFGTKPDFGIVCQYEVNAADRVLRCQLLSELQRPLPLWS
jgi:hypothetical protein